jgi:hypothetical protein
MNPGTFAGVGTGANAGAISRYTQSPIITSSRVLAIPDACKRIEALLVGGGGGGHGVSGAGGGGGFGGCAIMEIPAIAGPMSVVIGAGGTANNSGSPTYIEIRGTRYAEVGGGGGGNGANGRSGGGGAGTGNVSAAGVGGSPPLGNLIWSGYPQTSSSIRAIADTNTGVPFVPAGAGFPAYNVGGLGGTVYPGQNGSFGGGGGGGLYGGAIPGLGGGGGGGPTGGSIPTAGSFGGGGGGANSGGVSGVAGGSLTTLSVWGLTGFANGTGAANVGGGGGGLLGAGANAVAGTSGGNGGDGGGGGGGTGSSFTTAAGIGGNGLAIIRFFF